MGQGGVGKGSVFEYVFEYVFLIIFVLFSRFPPPPPLVF